MCPHTPPCPDARAPDREAARTLISHPEQGWSLLCNGVIVFDDTGDLNAVFGAAQKMPANGRCRRSEELASESLTHQGDLGRAGVVLPGHIAPGDQSSPRSL